MSSDIDDALDQIAKQVFVDEQATLAQKRAAKLMIERIRVAGAAGKAAADAIELANQLAADGDPHKQQIADALKKAVTGGAVKLAYTQAAQNGEDAGEGRSAVMADPFSSSGASKSLEQSGSSSNEPTSEPPKPRRGRPPKNRTNG